MNTPQKTADLVVRYVKKRDGGLEDFNVSRIADAIFKACVSIQIHDRLLADELAEVVRLYLVKNVKIEVPDVELIQDVVEKVLLETDHIEIAKAYILYRQDRARAREAFESDQDKANTVFINLKGRRLVWNPAKIAARLTQKTKLPRSFWEDILKVVEGLILE